MLVNVDYVTKALLCTENSNRAYNNHNYTTYVYMYIYIYRMCLHTCNKILVAYTFLMGVLSIRLSTLLNGAIVC